MPHLFEALWWFREKLKSLWSPPLHWTLQNLKYKISSFILVVFHNLSGKDAHYFIRQLGEKHNTKDIGVIAENKEMYISFNVKIDVQVVGVTNEDGKPVTMEIEIRFIDSYKFMSSGLDSLAKNLTGKQCKYLRWFYQEDFELMQCKGVSPYEHIDNWERFEETRLPPKEAFYSKLNMEVINEKDYNEAQQVWNIMAPEGPENTLGAYHDVYLAANLLLLEDLFDTFTDTCLKKYKMDLVHFYAASGTLLCKDKQQVNWRGIQLWRRR